jgi:hypothetical protein
MIFSITTENKGKVKAPSIQVKEFSLQSGFFNVDTATPQRPWSLCMN